MSRPERVPGSALAREAQAEIERRLGHGFASPELLARALTHSSRAHEEGDSTGGNERLEFLGDAVLDVIVSELLMELHPRAREGVLSRARAAAVREDALADQARQLGIDGFLRLGRGEDQSGGRRKASVLADAFEAVLGALYLDGGLPAVRQLVDRQLRPSLSAQADHLDAKTRLQESVQKRGLPLPEYTHAHAEGPAHAPEFEACVRIGGAPMGQGRGRSKREAEQAAAAEALERLET